MRNQVGTREIMGSVLAVWSCIAGAGTRAWNWLKPPDVIEYKHRQATSHKHQKSNFFHMNIPSRVVDQSVEKLTDAVVVSQWRNADRSCTNILVLGVGNGLQSSPVRVGLV